MFLSTIFSKYGALDSLESLLSSASFVLFLVSISSAKWVIFYDVNNASYSVGLWNACMNDECKPAWSLSSPVIQQSIDETSVPWGTYFLHLSAPALIVSAQVFLITAVVIQLLSVFMCKWSIWIKALVKSIPALLSTVGVICGIYFFQEALKQTPQSFHQIGGTWGYASACGLVGVLLIWLSIICSVIQAILERQNELAQKQRQFSCFSYEVNCCSLA
jgi:hypothetical protein